MVRYLRERGMQAESFATEYGDEEDVDRGEALPAADEA